jgi:hypothetical protein
LSQYKENQKLSIVFFLHAQLIFKRNFYRQIVSSRRKKVIVPFSLDSYIFTLMDANHLQTRGDFRCAVCRDKACFHCEHDTPYRDIYLGTYDDTTPRNYVINTERSKSEHKMHPNHAKHNSGSHTGRQPNSTIDALITGRHGNSNTGAKYQHGKKLDHTTTTTTTTTTNHHNDESVKTAAHNKNSKSCVIL